MNEYTYIYTYTHKHTHTHTHTHIPRYKIIRARDCATGRRRLIGSPKLQIIVHKRATKYRSLLRKMTYMGILWVFATLYRCRVSYLTQCAYIQKDKHIYTLIYIDIQIDTKDIRVSNSGIDIAQCIIDSLCTHTYITTCKQTYIHTCTHTWIHRCIDTTKQQSESYRVAKTHRIPYLYRLFSAKVTYIQWLFCGKWSAI